MMKQDIGDLNIHDFQVGVVKSVEKKLVGLEDRLVFEEGDYSELLARPIDWIEINQKVEEQSQQAYEFLELGLEGHSDGH